MKIDTAGRIIGSFLVVTAYFIILHVNLSLGVIMQFVGDAISVPFFQHHSRHLQKAFDPLLSF